MVKRIKRTAKRKTRISTRKKTGNNIIKLGKKTIKIKHPGATGDACRKMGYASGCDPRCLSKLEKRGGVWAKRAALARSLCKMKKKRK